MNISKETFDLHKIYTLVRNANTRAQVLSKEKTIAGGAKDFIKRSIINRLTAIENDLKGLFIAHPDDRDLVNNEILNDEVTFQLEGINDMLLALPKGIRDQIEQYVEQQYFVYSQKAASKVPVESTAVIPR